MRTNLLPTSVAAVAFETIGTPHVAGENPATSSKASTPIVFGTDCSVGAETALEVTGEFARRIKAPLALVHAMNLPRTLARDAKASRWLAASRKRSLRASAAALRRSGVKVIESVLPERADSAYLKVAGDEQAQLIVLAAERRPSGLRWLRRSAPNRMAARTRTPLVVLRQPERLRAWLLGVRPLKVVVAYNFTATANAALRWVNELRRAGPCEVVLVYANHPTEDHVRIGARGPLPFGENPPDVLAVLERDIKARARAVLGSVPVRCRIEPDAARTHIRLAELARDVGADLIVAGSRQLTGWKRLVHGSVLRDLLRTAATNVAIIPFTPTPPFRIPMRRHVLVATDFSAVGNAAIPHALSLLRDGGILTLMHVRSMPSAIREATRRDSGSNAKLSSDAGRIIARRLRRLVPTDAADRGILTQIEVPVTHAEPGEAISQAAERLGVDAICLGTASRSELSRAFLGSVTRTVRSLTRRPLLLVPAARL